MSISREQLVKTVNENFDLPLVGEGVEATIIDACVGALWGYVPPQVWDAAASAADGLTAEEVAHMLDGAVELAAKNIRIAYVPESLRRQVLTHVVEYIKEYCQLDKALSWLNA